MWFLSSFGIQDGAFGLVDTENSLLAVIGSAIAVIFAPLGFDTWQAVASSLSGFVAKEGYRFNNGCTLRTWRGRRVCSKHA